MDSSTVFVSLVSSLCVVAATEAIRHLKDSRAYKRDRNRENFERMKELYAERLAGFDKCIRQTHGLQTYSNLYDELPLLNARFALMSPQELIEQSEQVGDLIEQWSAEYRQGAPKKIGDTGAAIISSSDGPHQAKAKELYPALMAESTKLLCMMQAHLKTIEA